MSHPIKSPRKLIEVALPLDAINTACTREKSIRFGHPSTFHLWWARRPLAAARAVIFAQLVNDPGYQQGGGFKFGKNKKEAAVERLRLFRIIEDLVVWENSNNEEVLARARAEIRKSWQAVCELNKDHPNASELFNPQRPPAFHDPFSGGGTIPLEAQRLGIESHASDLNPVAVLISKAMIEIPHKFAGRKPLGPIPPSDRQATLPGQWLGATGIAEDVRRYGSWMRSEAERRLAHLFPKIEITKEIARHRDDLSALVGQKLTVIAWLWARTVVSPNPAYSHVRVPLVTSFVVSSSDDKDVYLEPHIERGTYRFDVKVGTAPQSAKGGTKLARGANFRCIMSDTPIDQAHIRAQFIAKNTGQRLLTVVAESPYGRVYLPATAAMQSLAESATPKWIPDVPMNQDSTDLLSGRGYGFTSWHELFTARQLVALTTLSDLVGEAVSKAKSDALRSGMQDDALGLEAGGLGASAYADAIGVYLALAVDKVADYNSSLVAWSPGRDQAKTTFARQALPMVWDFAEVNMFAGAAGDLDVSIQGVCRSLQVMNAGAPGYAVQADAQSQSVSRNKWVSTDPPYYNNIAYADLSDFFYVWLRPALRRILPSLFATMAVPKEQELTAFAYRHGSKEKAEEFFLNGMTQAMRRLAEQAHPEGPLTIYYAFKQAETDSGEGTSSTGWETFLEAVHRSGLQLTGTWPMRTERDSRSIGIGNNALASSIILVCRNRSTDAPVTSRRDFIRELNSVLPEALDEMTKGSGDDRSPVAPVDLSQAIIGPGMAVFSRYNAVLEADGSTMKVRTALQLINRFLAEDDFDADTQFCLHWFEQNGWKEGPYGDAETLSRAKGTSVSGIKDAGVVASGGGIVRLLKWSEYSAGWDPQSDQRQPVWETLHHLIRALKNDGESGAGRLLSLTKSKAESARQLAYRLYTLCERKGWAEDARAYNELITSWSGIEAAAGEIISPQDRGLFD